MLKVVNFLKIFLCYLNWNTDDALNLATTVKAGMAELYIFW